MASIDTSDKNYQISDDLLNVLIEIYEQALCTQLDQQLNLLQEDPDQIKYNLARAAGMGEMLRQLFRHVPKERIDGRQHIRQSLFGSDRGGDQGRGGGGASSDTSSRPSKGTAAFFSTRS